MQTRDQKGAKKVENAKKPYTRPKLCVVVVFEMRHGQRGEGGGGGGGGRRRKMILLV